MKTIQKLTILLAISCSLIGFEINEKYFNIAKDRLNGINAKGQMSLLDTDFDKVQIETDLLK